MNRIYFLVCFLFLLGCGDDEPNEEVTLPSALVIDVDLSKASDGIVSVQASAEKANFFKISFGETTGDVPVTATDGKAMHTYERSGTYTITVQAHATDAAFISDTETINVVIEEITDELVLVWEDEFNGNAVNEADWTFEIGRGANGWGNNELQYYRKENTTVADGFLTIEARKESFQGADYTSSRMITMGKQSFKYGRIDIRAKLPKGQGIWPALWMLGDNISSVGWPASGEIDIMEMVGGQGREKTVHGTLHWDNNGSRACTCDRPGYSLPSGIFNDDFHVFSIQWTESAITWYVDDIQFDRIDITPPALSEFKNPFFFIFNVAVGGNWPGSPDGTTTFPQQMVVDYVRVFQEK